jgi:hypothetical protein
MAGFLSDLKRNLPAKKKAARVWRLFGSLAALFQIERDPPAASELP